MYESGKARTETDGRDRDEEAEAVEENGNGSVDMNPFCTDAKTWTR